MDDNIIEDVMMRKNDDGDDDDDDDVELPGFRFHPTDEELVGFYLRRQLQKKPIRIELIKQIDIYKYDPWDLPKASSTGGEKEWYFFCRRGRKYRNSIRPNRVTGSGFWKATGIDKPVYASGDDQCIIGLKKTLVYYRGSAGKGTKTDWMMHEFRLPNPNPNTNNNNTFVMNHHHHTNNNNFIKNNNNAAIATTTSTIAHEAEIWTLCRIFKRNVTQKKHIIPEWRSLVSSNKHATTQQYNSSIIDKGTRLLNNNTISNLEYDDDHTYTTNNNKQAYINFGGANNNINNSNYNNNNNNNNGHYYYYPKINHHELKPASTNNNAYNYNYASINNIDEKNYQFDHHHYHQLSQVAQQSQEIMEPSPTASGGANDSFMFDNWDELGSVVKFAFDSM